MATFTTEVGASGNMLLAVQFPVFGIDSILGNTSFAMLTNNSDFSNLVVTYVSAFSTPTSPKVPTGSISPPSTPMAGRRATRPSSS